MTSWTVTFLCHIQVFNKMLSLATLSATADYKTGRWDNIILSTESVRAHQHPVYSNVVT